MARKALNKKAGAAPRPGSLAAQRAATVADKDRFLEAYAAIGTISGAAQHAGIGKRTHYNWLAADPEYAARFGETHETAVDRAEQELRRRGVVGYDKPVYQGGKQVGTIREYSDTCLIFYLKGRRRDVFGDRQEHSGPGGGPIVTSPVDPKKLSLDTLRRLITEAEAE
jgi:hypothetical protein